MKQLLLNIGHLLVFCLLITGCNTPVSDSDLTEALNKISDTSMASDIEILASDEFEGRAPSSPGEEKTIAYLEKRFREIGVEAGNGDSYFQEVPLIDITANPDMTLTVEDEMGRQEFRYGTEFMAWTKRVVEEVTLDPSEMIFVGYGIVAPEYDWDDYANLDVTGKTVIMLVNDPGFGGDDDAFFKGNTMTYYGRWTYKFEEAARQGAAAAFIVHETIPAAYPWPVVSNSWSGPQFNLVADDNNMSRVAVEGWLQLATTREIFQRAGLDFDALKFQARERDFEAIPLRINASTMITNTLRRSTSNNVVAILPGRLRPDEYVINMAHWDHFGVDPTLDGDQIYNGAYDNATGIAGLLALAEAYSALPEPPERSVVFLALTAEEQGLLGGAYYAEYPIYDHAKTVAAINMDGMNTIGPTHDITIVGYGNSELDQYLADAAASVNRVIRPDPEPEKGFFYRSDHFSFAKKGVPALYPDNGIDHVEFGEEYGLQKRAEYNAERYHKPSDEYDPETWDLRGAAQDAQLMFQVGFRIANSDDWPAWNEGTEFKAIRESSLAQ